MALLIEVQNADEVEQVNDCLETLPGDKSWKANYSKAESVLEPEIASHQFGKLISIFIQYFVSFIRC